MLIWPKHVTVGLCCLISCDGSIYYGKPDDGVGKSSVIYLFHSVEKDWVKQIHNVMRDNKIGTSIVGPYKRDPEKSNIIIKTEHKDTYRLFLNRRYPKGRPSGINQWQTFRNSIEYWGVQDYLIKRKYDKLCKMTKLMDIIDIPKMQSSIF